MSERNKIKSQFIAGDISGDDAFASMVHLFGSEVARIELKNWIVIKKNVDKT